MLADPEVNRFYERRFTRSDAQVWLDRQLERYRRDGHGLWLLLDRETGVPITTHAARWPVGAACVFGLWVEAITSDICLPSSNGCR